MHHPGHLVSFISVAVVVVLPSFLFPLHSLRVSRNTFNIPPLPLSFHLIIFLWRRLIENLCFLFGSAYFVSGSYPDGSMLIDDDFLSTSIDGEMEDGFYLKVSACVICDLCCML